MYICSERKRAREQEHALERHRESARVLETLYWGGKKEERKGERESECGREREQEGAGGKERERERERVREREKEEEREGERIPYRSAA